MIGILKIQNFVNLLRKNKKEKVPNKTAKHFPMT